MSIKSLEFPLSSSVFSDTHLRAYVSSLNLEDKQQLEKEVYLQAIKDGVVIEGWDKEWAKYHLFENTARLIGVLFEKKKGDLFQGTCLDQKMDLSKNMSIRSSESSLFSSIFSDTHLRAYVSSLNLGDKQQLEKGVYLQAIKDGVVIEGWDKEWAKYHLFENTARLIGVLFEKKKRDLFQGTYLDQKVDCIVNHLIYENLLFNEADPALIRRVKFIADLDTLKRQLDLKYPRLFVTTRDNAWRAIETYCLTLPIAIEGQEMERFENFISVIEELLGGNYNLEGVEIILDRLLAKEVFHPTSTDLSNYLQLKSLRQMTNMQIHNHTLQRAEESLWKSISVIHFHENKQGKFKSLDIHSATREVYASQCDRLFGFGMTASTELLSFKNFFQSINEVKKLFISANTELRLGNLAQAKSLRQQAFNLFNESYIPQEVRNSIFWEIYLLYGNGAKIGDLGQKLFYNSDGCSTSDLRKSVAIKNYLNSDAFKWHQSVFNVQGSIQPWISECGRAYDLIVKDPNGGEKLKSAPKTLAHLYALLGIIKGSKDCSSGNTFVEYSPALGRVVNFWDFDDERSMPTTAHFRDFRLWQLGLPQCAQPFDRAVLLMFNDPMLIKKLKKQQTSLQISQEAYDEQTKRLEQIILIFRLELEKDKIALTPRDLFFMMFGGRQEFESIKNGFNNDKSCGEEGIRIAPIELFEFHLSNIGVGSWYTGDEGEKYIIGKNMRVLYYPELP